jgi:hypothetical protein
MPNTNTHDETVTVDQAAEAFLEKYPDWQENQSLKDIFDDLEELTRIDVENASNPKKVFKFLLDQYDNDKTYSEALSEAEDESGRLPLNDWFVILAFFADCNIDAFSKRFNSMTSDSYGKKIPLRQLKSRLPSTQKVSSNQRLESMGLTDREQKFVNFCLQQMGAVNSIVQLTSNALERKFAVVGEAGRLTNRAVDALSWSSNAVEDVQGQLSEENLIWIEDGRQSREKGKRLAVWIELV